MCKRDPLSGKVTTGGIVTIKDSVDNWYLSWTINRQPQFKRQEDDRPLVVPHNAKNFAFIGQFAETPRDTIFTTEYSIRTSMKAI